MDFEDLDYDKITELLNKRDAEEKQGLKKKRDWVAISATILSLAAWIIMIAVWVIIEYASPEREMLFMTTFFNVHFGAVSSVRTRWNMDLVLIAYILMIVALGLCLISFVLNTMGMKRKGKKPKISIFLIGSITIIVFVMFMINFGPMIF